MGLHQHCDNGPVRDSERGIALTMRPKRLRYTALLTSGVALAAVGVLMMAFSFISGFSAHFGYVLGVATWLIAGFNGAFHPYIGAKEFGNLPVVALSALAAGAVAAALAAANVIDQQLTDVVTLSSVAALALIAGTLCGRITLRGLWSRGRFRSTALVVGSGVLSRELAVELRHRPEFGIDLVEYVAIEDIDSVMQGTISDALAEKLVDKQPDRLIVGCADSNDEGLLPALRLAGMLGTRVYVLPRFFSMGVGTTPFGQERLRGYPLQRVNRITHPELGLAAKRAMDITVSLTALVLLSPILVVAALAVKLTSSGDVLFWQERVGQNGRIIRIPKFRSMRPSANSDFEWTAEARTTQVGRFLRRSAIDELPQLWSVLRGDMSLVGPRPERPAFAMQFAEEHLEYASRHRMPTGMTGLAQIAGLRGDTSIAERAKFDNLYIDQWSLTGDVMILLRTVGAIIDQRARTTAQRRLETALTWATPTQSADVLGSPDELHPTAHTGDNPTRRMQRV